MCVYICVANALKQACELNQAMYWLQIGSFTHATAACDVVLQSDPSNVKALYRRAQAAHALKDFPGCIRDCRRAVEVAPQNREVRALLKQAQESQREVHRHAQRMYSRMAGSLGCVRRAIQR